MNVAKTLIDKFKSIDNCYVSLIGFEIKVCKRCNSMEFYYTKNWYEKVCTECKTKYKLTHNTPFYNVRFGLTKAFSIYIEYFYLENKPTVSYLSKEYNISYKTCWLFIKKIDETEDNLRLKQFLSKNSIINLKKIYLYIIKDTP